MIPGPALGRRPAALLMAISPTKVIYHAPGHPTNQEKAGRGGRQPRRLRQGWSHPELTALAIVASAIAGFAIYGVTTGAPSTVGYLGSVLAVTAVVVRLRHAPVSPALALSLGLLAVAHLAGGLVRVGDGVLYNAQFGSEVFRYDHLVHSSAVFVGTLVVYALFARQDRVALRRGPASVALWVLAGLGLGAQRDRRVPRHHPAGRKPGRRLHQHRVGSRLQRRGHHRRRRVLEPEHGALE